VTVTVTSSLLAAGVDVAVSYQHRARLTAESDANSNVLRDESSDDVRTKHLSAAAGNL
jgi:hypothetical protein